MIACCLYGDSDHCLLLYTCAGPSCATPPTCPLEALAAQLTLAAMWVAWGPATVPAQVRLKVQPTWPSRGDFVWAPKAIPACMYFCILSGVCRANCCRAVRRIGMRDVEGQMRRT